MLSKQRQFSICLLGILLFGLTSCLGGGQAPVYSRGEQQSERVTQKPVPQEVIAGSVVAKRKVNSTEQKNYYKVIKGDTLYSIAWRYKLDYKILAKWNAVRSPYVIHVGKKLRLIPPLKPVKEIAKFENPGPFPKPEPRPVPKEPDSKFVTIPVPKIPQQTSPKVKPLSVRKLAPVLPAKISSWQWPSRGKLISSNTVSARNGIDIKGKAGQPVKAAAAGIVVYSGSGLVGYGNLIIIKHNKTYLSAYAHNRRLLVEEGGKVKAGQAIAEMGKSGTNTVKLHFEIRKDGKSVDPLKYLPN